MLQRFLWLALCASYLLAASSARAQEPPPWTLAWVRGTGAETCVTREQLGAALERALSADSLAPLPVTIDGMITRDPTRGLFRARVQVLNGQRVLGVRELVSSDASCDAFTPSIVLVTSMLIELAAQAGTLAEAPVVSELPPAASKAAPRAAMGWVAELMLSLSVAKNFVPPPAVGPALALRVRSPWWITLFARTTFFAARAEHTDIGAGTNYVTVDSRAFATDVEVCVPAFQHPQLWLAGCLGPTFVARRNKHTYSPEIATALGVGSQSDRDKDFGAVSTLQLSYAFWQPLFVVFDASVIYLPRSGFHGGPPPTVPANVGEVGYYTDPWGVAFNFGLGVRL